jgi:hypothetical protein
VLNESIIMNNELQRAWRREADERRRYNNIKHAYINEVHESESCKKNPDIYAVGQEMSYFMEFDG